MTRDLSVWRENVRGGIQAALKLLPARSAADSVYRTKRIAARLTQVGLQDLSLSSSVLQKNQHSIVCRFDVRLSSRPSAEPLLQLVGKKAKHTRELRLYKLFLDDPFRPAAKIVPRVYCTKHYWPNNPDDYKSFILLEHLAACGLQDYSEATAHRLAERMCAVSAIEADQLHRIATAENQLSEDLVEQFIDAAHAGGYIESSETARTLESIGTDFRRLSEVRSELRLVPCHNDLHVKNLGVRATGEFGEYLFFDWEKFGLNHLGSDLHHFLVKGISEPDFRPFSDALHSRYRDVASDIHGVDRQSVDLAALSYSLFRSIKRSVDHRNSKKRRMQVNQVSQLYTRLKRMMCFPIMYAADFFSHFA